MLNTRRIRPNPRTQEPAAGSRRHEQRREACRESMQVCRRHNPQPQRR